MLRLLQFTVLLAPLSVWAHPGDHHEGWLASLVHLMTQPDHLVLILPAIIMGLILLRRHLVKRKLRHGS